MSAHISLKVRLGPLVSVEIEGEDCQEISRALEGWESLNRHIDGLCGDLAQRVYPDGPDMNADAASENRDTQEAR